MSKKFLIIEARFYNNISDILVDGAIKQLELNKFKYERLEVPGALEIPAAIAMAARTGFYAGFVALGCVIKGQTPHFNFISQSTTNAIMDISIKCKKPIGNGIITCDNKKQAVKRADPSKKDKGGDAEVVLKSESLKGLEDKFGKKTDENEDGVVDKVAYDDNGDFKIDIVHSL